MKYPKNRPLKCEVIDGELKISIGVKTLAFAVKIGLRGEGRWPKEVGAISCAEGFAQEMLDAIEAEREDGSTHLTDLLDWAAREAIDQGSQHVNWLHNGKIQIAGEKRKSKGEV